MEFESIAVQPESDIVERLNSVLGHPILRFLTAMLYKSEPPARLDCDFGVKDIEKVLTTVLQATGVGGGDVGGDVGGDIGGVAAPDLKIFVA
jgi:hypothetical protein